MLHSKGVRALLMLLALNVTGCFATIPIDSGSLFAAADPNIARCKKKLSDIKKSYNDDVTWTKRLAIGAIALGAGTLVVSSLQSASRPGDGSASLDEALEQEGKVTLLEGFSITLSALTALDVGLTAYFGGEMSQKAKEKDTLINFIDELSLGTGATPTPGEIEDKCS